MGTELKPSKPHNATDPLLWLLTSSSTLSHWMDMYMDHLGSVVLHECKLPRIYIPESTLLCNGYNCCCCYLSSNSVLYLLRGKTSSLLLPLTTWSTCHFNSCAFQCTGNNQQLPYCIVMHYIAISSLLLKTNWYLKQLSWHCLSP